ncbi:hypothetical protein [Hazenella coriacea]|uniref:Uncharacterized protein n=1 Tax=Hazenella coriacea TaxID=1179467 RepID=A0A4R3LGD9_9BACL|nr:hypothetical protein [Hazenella coriacea]TCS96576.1 hypothetical protein EDD58_101211 [Hazenella coriacea]
MFYIRVPKESKNEILKEYPGQSSFTIKETPKHLFLGIFPAKEEIEMFPEIKDKIPTEEEVKKCFS